MTLKERLAAGDQLDGIVVRTPSYQVIEVLAATGAGLVMIDTEHAAVDPESLDAMLAVATALGLDALVRVPAGDRPAVQRALDAGAAGIVFPHVDAPARASEAVRWSHYGEGGRGYSGSTRSAGWGTRSLAAVVADAAAQTAVVVQVEDAAALEAVGGIAATPGVDALFVGAADLAVALGADGLGEPAVAAACDAVVGAARNAGRSAVAVATSPADEQRWRAAGVNVVLHATDQSRLHL